MQVSTPKFLVVVGAGASKEAHLPTGIELRDIIAQRVTFKFDDFGKLESGNNVLYQSLRKLVDRCEDPDINIHAMMRAAKSIESAIHHASSIDSYIDSHYGQRGIEICGKFAVAQNILEAEKRSLLRPLSNGGGRIDIKDLENTWYADLMGILVEGSRRETIGERLSRIGFITFNYDRCIERFLHFAIANYFDMEPKEIDAVMENLIIVHPYGQVGFLPWQGCSPAISFGQEVTSRLITAAASEIKTFTEQEDDEAIHRTRRMVAEAETVIFIGFAFHSQNMKLLEPLHRPAVAKVFATAYGMSAHNAGVVEAQLLKMFHRGGPSKPDIYVRRDLNCHGLFQEFSKSLAVA